MHPLPVSDTQKSKHASLAEELQEFLYDLDSEYPAQVFAVYRIGAKLIGDIRRDGGQSMCQKCRRPINYDYESAASRAMNAARMVDKQNSLTVESLLNSHELHENDESGHYQHDTYCYNCK